MWKKNVVVESFLPSSDAELSFFNVEETACGGNHKNWNENYVKWKNVKALFYVSTHKDRY